LNGGGFPLNSSKNHQRINTKRSNVFVYSFQLNPSFAQKIRGKSWLVLDSSIEEFAVHALGYLSHNRASNPCCQREKGRAKDLTQFLQSAKSR